MCIFTILILAFRTDTVSVRDDSATMSGVIFGLASTVVGYDKDWGAIARVWFCGFEDDF